MVRQGERQRLPFGRQRGISSYLNLPYRFLVLLVSCFEERLRFVNQVAQVLLLLLQKSIGSQ